MPGSWKRSVSDSIHDHAMIIALLLILFLCAEGRFRVYYVIPALIFCRMRTKDLSWLILVFCFLVCIIPRGRSTVPDITEGIVTNTGENYAEVRSKCWHVRLYTKEPLPLDTRIAFEADWSRIEPFYSFYGTDHSLRSAARGIYYSGTLHSWKIIKQYPSIRRWIQNRVNVHPDRNILLRVLLGIRTDELVYSGYLMEGGLSFAGLLMAVEKLLKYLMTEKYRERTMIAVNAVLALIYRFPFVLLQSLIYRLLKRTELGRSSRLGASTIICLCIYPYAVSSAAFWLPFIYRFSGIFSEHPRLMVWYAGMIVQSILFRAINPVSALLYPYTALCTGILYGVGILSLLCPYLSTERLFTGMDRCLSLFNGFRIPGSVLGAGLPFYLLTVLCLRKNKHAAVIQSVLLLVFQVMGLFHPLGEITFINVGQGDAILIREPLNRNNILIDTGKPTAYHHLTAILDAKGIRTISTMFITHDDNDHSGNMVHVSRDYRAQCIITEHFGTMTSGSITFHDLNTINDDDKNRSSLVQLFRYNGMNILCMGDADRVTEEQITRNYAELKISVLKASHHGSATGSSQRFLETIQPDLAVISCGPYRIYHHPNREVLERLRRNRIPYLDTHSQGDITILCFPGFNLLITASGRFSFLPAGNET